MYFIYIVHRASDQICAKFITFDHQLVKSYISCTKVQPTSCLATFLEDFKIPIRHKISVCILPLHRTRNGSKGKTRSLGTYGKSMLFRFVLFLMRILRSKERKTWTIAIAVDYSSTSTRKIKDRRPCWKKQRKDRAWTMVELKLSIIIYACGMVFISYICIYIQYMLVVVSIVSYTLPGRRAWGHEEEGIRNWKRSSTLLVKNLGGFG